MSRAATLMALIAVSCALVAPRASRAQGATLHTGGSRAAAGVHVLGAGFVPDPFELAIAHEVGPIDALRATRTSTCRGFARAEPSAIVRYAGPSSFLRLYARASSADVSLVVNDAAGRWHCGTDVSPDEPSPMIDIYDPPSGQYDVWITGAQRGGRIEARLFVTEMRAQRP